MPAAPLPPDEDARIEALLRLDVLDTASDPQLDAIVEVASLVCGTPISLVSLVDTDRQWFKAAVGVGDVTETPRDVAFCAHAIYDDALLEVEDARGDPRFQDNALVTGEPNIRFYAGVPLRLRSGHLAGTLCVIDQVPRKLDDRQREILASLARAAVLAMEKRVEARDRRAAAKEQAAQAEALMQESGRKNSFLSALAHELRGPLGAMKNGLFVLNMAASRKNAGDTKIQSMLERQVDHMNSLVNGLMDIGGIAAGKVELQTETLDMHGVVAQAVETCLPALEAKRHDLLFALSETPLRVEADAARLRQIIVNLVTNAAKYTPDQGRITIASWREPSFAALEIADNGMGIARPALESIFKMYEQVHPVGDQAQGGLGIGLALVRQLTELHGGSVTADSDGLGKGARFTVRIPLAR